MCRSKSLVQSAEMLDSPNPPRSCWQYFHWWKKAGSNGIEGDTLDRGESYRKGPGTHQGPTILIYILLPTIPVHLCESTITCLNLYSAISCCVSWVGAGDMRQCCRCQTKSGGGTLQNYCTATATAPVHQCSGGTLWCTEDAKLLHNSAQQGGERSVRAAIHCTTVRL